MMGSLAEPVSSILEILYILVVAALAVYGLFGLYTIYMFWRLRGQLSFTPAHQLAGPEAASWPPVTVQLPIFNERYVVERLIQAVVAFEYPRDKLEIQVLDDSTDDTTRLAAQLVECYQAQGYNIHLLHRADRRGYKAGALKCGLEESAGDFIAIFDADFQPAPDFLRATISHLLAEPEIGMVQARWGHLNAGDSVLTAVQAISLDKHFAVEQAIRSRATLFPKFNGAAGVWRRQCILDAGGWQDDTVCEDLCLSTRAALKGWRLRFLPDTVALAELPGSISALKSQQARWAKGSTQCLLKYGPGIWRSPNRLAARLYALFSMSSYLTSVLLILLLLLQVPLLALNETLPSWLVLCGLAGLGQPVLFVVGQRLLYRDWIWRLRHMPMLILIAMGLSVTIARAVFEAVSGKAPVFVRTPKYGANGHQAGERYSSPLDRGLFLELGLALYAAAGIWIALERGNTGVLLLLLTLLIAYLYVGLNTLSDRLHRAG